MGTPPTITGDYTQTSTGMLRVLVTPAGMKHLIVFRHRASGGDALLCIAARYIRPGSYQFLTAAGGGSRDFATVETSKASQHSQNVSAATVSAAQSVAAEGPVAALTMSKQLIVAPADETLFANAVRPRCWKAWR